MLIYFKINTRCMHAARAVDFNRSCITAAAVGSTATAVLLLPAACCPITGAQRHRGSRDFDWVAACGPACLASLTAGVRPHGPRRCGGLAGSSSLLLLPATCPCDQSARVGLVLVHLAHRLDCPLLGCVPCCAQPAARLVLTAQGSQMVQLHRLPAAANILLPAAFL